MRKLMYRKISLTPSDFKGVMNGCVYCTTDIKGKEDDCIADGVEIVFKNVATGMFSSLLIYNDGTVYLSEEY